MDILRYYIGPILFGCVCQNIALVATGIDTYVKLLLDFLLCFAMK